MTWALAFSNFSLLAAAALNGYTKCRWVACIKAAFSVWREGANMDDLLREYLPILLFLGVAIGLSLVMVLASVIIVRQHPDPEKLMAYECGFDAFGESRDQFDVRFYLVAILFIIFDLEVAFLFPWSITLGQLGMAGFWSMMVFLGVLTVGFVYEWKKGALEWD